MSYEKQNFQDGQVLTAEQLNKMEQYFQYCPQCYIEYGDEVEYLPSTELVFNEGMSMLQDVVDSVTSGATYTVNYNGVEYTVIGQALSGEMSGVGLGDLSMMGLSGNGEPFAIMLFSAEFAASNGMGCMVAALDGAESATISISGREVIKVHKLDEAFLPETIVFDYSDSNTIICKYSAEDLFGMLEINSNRAFVFRGSNYFANSCSVSREGKVVDEEFEFWYTIYFVYMFTDDINNTVQEKQLYVKVTASEITYHELT